MRRPWRCRVEYFAGGRLVAFMWPSQEYARWSRESVDESITNKPMIQSRRQCSLPTRLSWLACPRKASCCPNFALEAIYCETRQLSCVSAAMVLHAAVRCMEPAGSDIQTRWPGVTPYIGG
jgi:hypothetical protein